MRSPIYIVFDGRERDERSVMLVTRNPRTAAEIYFRERQKVHGERPYVYAYILGDSDSEKLIGHDELLSFYNRGERYEKQCEKQPKLKSLLNLA